LSEEFLPNEGVRTGTYQLIVSDERTGYFSLAFGCEIILNIIICTKLQKPVTDRTSHNTVNILSINETKI